MIIQASNKKQYAIETKSLVRILASGLKFTDEAMKNLGIKIGDKVNHAYDDETGAIYLFKTDSGSIIGKSKTFTNTGFKSALLKLASGAAIKADEKETGETVSQDTKIKGGLQIVFEVSPTAVESDGVKYHQVSFKEAVIDADDEETAEAPTAEKEGF